MIKIFSEKSIFIFIIICLCIFACSKTDTEIHRLKHPDPSVRFKAATALVKIGAPTVDPLLRFLINENTTVQSEAISILVKIGGPAVEPLIAALKDKNDSVRSAAATALGKIKDPRAVEPLIDALKDKNDSIRSAAATALGIIKDSRAVEPLIASLAIKGEDYSGVSPLSAATIALIEIGGPAVEPLIDALKNKNPSVRSAAAIALGKIGMPKVEPLVAALKDKNPSVRSAAATALVEIGAVNSLIAAIKNTPSLKENPNIKNVIMSTFNSLLQHGKADTENIIISILNEYGTVSMAENLLNCNNTQLIQAAKMWAQKHNYGIIKKTLDRPSNFIIWKGVR